MNQNNEQSQATGKVGEVYAKPTGNTIAEETEYTIGWYQTSKDLRVKVKYTRVSHSMCVWKRA
ncbi:MAG: hypothetical protein Q8K55_14410 [Gemmatimonadaceae bacterium]|nr:hypothetical protein [Gemmatimonadaceae bacterium]